MSDAKKYRNSKRAALNSKSRAKSLRKDQTPPEGLLWWVLRRNQILGQRFRRQAPIGVYIADFYCHDLRLVIEVDGRTHQQEQLKHDARRDQWMESQGIMILRVQAVDVFENLQGVQRTIEKLAKQKLSELPSE